jgi:hypothetical protein
VMLFDLGHHYYPRHTNVTLRDPKLLKKIRA